MFFTQLAAFTELFPLGIVCWPTQNKIYLKCCVIMFLQDEMKKKAILKALKLYFGQEAEHPLDFSVKVSTCKTMFMQ